MIEYERQENLLLRDENHRRVCRPFTLHVDNDEQIEQLPLSLSLLADITFQIEVTNSSQKGKTDRPGVSS